MSTETRRPMEHRAMYASVRVYDVIPERLPEMKEIVKEHFLPAMDRSRGLISYCVVDAGNGRCLSISVFESESDSRAAGALAAQLVGEWLLPMVRRGPEIVAGEVVVSSASAVGSGS